MENTLTRKKQIITAKALTTVIGITLSVSMPQLFHVIGIVSGTGSLPGSAFLPMHLGVFFTALLAGPAVGAVTGAVSPLLSFALTGYAVGGTSSVYDDRAYRIRRRMRTPQKQKNARHFKGTHGSNTRKSHTRGCYFNRVLRL